jgi:hypothetical protein
MPESHFVGHLVVGRLLFRVVCSDTLPCESRTFVGRHSAIAIDRAREARPAILSTVSPNLSTPIAGRRIDFQHRNVLGGGEWLGVVVRRGTKTQGSSVIRLEMTSSVVPVGMTWRCFQIILGNTWMMAMDHVTGRRLKSSPEQQRCL